MAEITRNRLLQFWIPAFAGMTLFVVQLLVGSTANAQSKTYNMAILQGLDKVTGRVSKLEAPIGDVARFGTLEIITRHCHKRPPEETPESAAFLDIWEVRTGEPAKGVFRGWMFASSPALSAMEHAVYDVWVLDCVITDSSEAISSEDPAPE